MDQSKSLTINTTINKYEFYKNVFCCDLRNESDTPEGIRKYLLKLLSNVTFAIEFEGNKNNDLEKRISEESHLHEMFTPVNEELSNEIKNSTFGIHVKPLECVYHLTRNGACDKTVSGFLYFKNKFKSIDIDKFIEYINTEFKDSIGQENFDLIRNIHFYTPITNYIYKTVKFYVGTLDDENIEQKVHDIANQFKN